MTTALRAAFGVVATLVAAPAEACSRRWMVFFDPGSVALTARSAEVLQHAAGFFLDRRPPTEAELGCGPLSPGAWMIVIRAQAQDPGSDACALSFRRGHAIRARLVALGVPSDDVTVRALGDRQPLVPTPPGRTDPLNRNAELFFVSPQDMPVSAVAAPSDACPATNR